MVMIPFSMLQNNTIYLYIDNLFTLSEESRIIVNNISNGTKQHSTQIIPLAP